MVNFIKIFWKSINPLYLTAFFSIAIYLFINYYKIEDSESAMLIIFNILTIFAGTVGIAKLLEQKSEEEVKDMVKPTRKYKGVNRQQYKEGKKVFFGKWF